MFFKLALRNVRRSFRDYGVYLLTLTFGVCLFYTFNALEGQGAMTYLSRSYHDGVRVILTLVDVFSVFVAVVLACLILYANSFLMRRRKRELGTYLLLGLSQGQVSRLLFLETGVVGLLSLIAGLALGVLASYGLSALTLSMFAMDLSELLAIQFSFQAAIKTMLYFGLIFLFVMALSGIQVSRAKLIDLMQGARKNEELRQRPLRASVWQLALGVILLLAAYAILLCFGMTIAVVVLPICAVMLALGTLGTLLIFKSLSGFVLRLVQRRPELYFRGLNLFTLRQWISRVHSTYLSQTVICLLLLLAIGITASSIGLNNTLEASVDYQAPFDITVQNQSGDTVLADFSALAQSAGAQLAWQSDLLFYYNDPQVTGTDEVSAALKCSDYNCLLERSGRPAYSGPLPFQPEDWDRDLVTGSLGLTYVVVDDQAAGQLKVRRQVWCADYAGPAEQTEQALMSALEGLKAQAALRINSRLIIYAELMGNKLLALFLGLYLGVTFLLAAAAVLALQQLSQGADNASRYAVLRRLGAEERQTARSATQQVALAFLLPLALALVHSMVGMKAANDVIAQLGRVDIVHSSAVTALVLLAVYGGYFWATALACRRMSRGDRLSG